MIVKKIFQHRKMLTSNNFNLFFKRTNINSKNDISNIKSNQPQDLKNDPLNKGFSLPEEPTTCCMSGCPDCVWMQYAEKVSQYFSDGGENAKKIIMEKIQDENMKAFLLMELRTISLKK